jgi:hypothetical protein
MASVVSTRHSKTLHTPLAGSTVGLSCLRSEHPRSVRALYRDNAQRMRFSELIRGPQSFGALLEERGFASVPSADQPAPESNWAFFSGGYNTRRHGSRDSGRVSGVQVEVNQGARFDSDRRAAFAVALAEAIDAFVAAHYADQ